MQNNDAGGVIVVFLLILVGAVGSIPAYIAKSKGQENFVSWVIYGLLLWPIALLHAMGMNADSRALDNRAVAEGKLKRCGSCKEAIQKDAIVCPHCGKEDDAVKRRSEVLAKIYNEKFKKDVILDSGAWKKCPKCKALQYDFLSKCEKCDANISDAPIKKADFFEKNFYRFLNRL